MNKTIITALAMSMAFGVTAVDARGFGPKQATFSEVDTNSNGQISETEMGAMTANRFDLADANTDGFIDADEMKAHWENMADNMPGTPNGSDHSERMMERMGDIMDRVIARADEDEDGKISFEELMAVQPGLVFADIDTNEDGAVSEMEWHVSVDHRGGGRMQDRGQMWGRGHMQDRGQTQERGGWFGHGFGQGHGRN